MKTFVGIVQDSHEAWERNAAVMDIVYGHSCLTICAADGEDAHAGLLAMSTAREKTLARQHIEQCGPELELMVKHPCELYVQKSKWSTRGWTFQERLLSRRVLLFAEGRVYWQCCATTMSEEVDMESAISGRAIDVESSPMQSFEDMAVNPIEGYKNSVNQYTIRSLKHETDILAAFQGIGKLNGGFMGGQLIHGLPNTHFDWALLWEPEDSCRPRKAKKGHPPFPSWSWCGWAERPTKYTDQTFNALQDNLHDWLHEHCWINYYIRDGGGNLRLVWDAKLHKSANEKLDRRLRGYRAPPPDTVDYDNYGREIKGPMIGLPRTEFTRTTPDFAMQVRTIPMGEVDQDPEARAEDRNMLQFFTWSAYLYLEPESQEQPVSKDSHLAGRIHSRRYKILDATRTWQGTIVLDHRLRFNPKTPQHFIALSDAKQFSSAERSVRDRHTRRKDWTLYYVLLLGYDEEPGSATPNTHKWSSHDSTDLEGRIAKRIGLGKVDQTAFHPFHHSCSTFEQPDGTTWREIILG